MSNNSMVGSSAGTLRDIDLRTGKSLPYNSVDNFREIGDNNNMNNNTATWEVFFATQNGDAVISVVDGAYEVEVFGDLVAETDTIGEAFALAEDMLSFHNAVDSVAGEIEDEISELENELAALDKIGHYLGEEFSVILVDFLNEDLDEQLELLEAIENYDYNMFVEDRESEEDENNEPANDAEVNGNVRGPFSTI